MEPDYVQLDRQFASAAVACMALGEAMDCMHDTFMPLRHGHQRCNGYILFWYESENGPVPIVRTRRSNEITKRLLTRQNFRIRQRAEQKPSTYG